MESKVYEVWGWGLKGVALTGRESSPPQLGETDAVGVGFRGGEVKEVVLRASGLKMEQRGSKRWGQGRSEV